MVWEVQKVNQAGQSESGPSIEINSIRAFASPDKREEQRARLMAGPDWQFFLPNRRDRIEVAENKITKPASFSPVGGGQYS